QTAHPPSTDSTISNPIWTTATSRPTATTGTVSMRSTRWTPNDDEARRLLTERIDSYDNDGSLSLWERFIRWINEALTLNVDSSGAGSVVIVVLLAAAVAVLL